MHEAGPELPPIAAAPVSVLLIARPGFDEIDDVVRAWTSWLDQHHPEYELMVVLPVAPLTAPAAAKVRYVHQLTPAGFGPSLQTGLWLARHPLLLSAPCDRQFQPDDLARLFESIDKVHLVAGYRVLDPVPLWLRAVDLVKRLTQAVLLGYFGEARDQWLGWATAWRRFVIRRLFGVQVRDPECALALFRREVFRRIPIQSRGGFTPVEILAKANHLGFWISEAPVRWTPPSSTGPDADYYADRRTLLHAPDFGPALLPPESSA